MEQDEVTRKRNEVEKDLAEVASMIRPLPANVVPSEEFVRRTRLRLLRLESDPQAGDRQAA